MVAAATQKYPEVSLLLRGRHYKATRGEGKPPSLIMGHRAPGTQVWEKGGSQCSETGGPRDGLHVEVQESYQLSAPAGSPMGLGF